MSDPLRAKLIVADDQDPPREIDLRLPMVVGRGRESDLTLAHPLVSRKHCEFYEVEGVLCLRDLESLNGTYVGDIRITEASLQTDDVVTIGSVSFIVSIEGQPAASESSGEDDADPLMPPDFQPEKKVEMVEDELPMPQGSIDETTDIPLPRDLETEAEKPPAPKKPARPAAPATQPIVTPTAKKKASPKSDDDFADLIEGNEEAGADADDESLGDFLQGLE